MDHAIGSPAIPRGEGDQGACQPCDPVHIPPSGACYAHTRENRPPSEWEPLEDHLEAVANRAAEFAGAFGAAVWGRLAGLWHDLGKYRPEFQAYLRGQHAGVEHAGLGAALAHTRRSHAFVPLCFAIAGHHAGLANAASNAQAEQDGYTSLPRPLRERLEDGLSALQSVRSLLPPRLVSAPIPATSAWLGSLVENRSRRPEATRAMAFWTRMLFSALVDADRIETARFYSKHEPSLLHDELEYDDLATLRNRLDAQIDDLAAAAMPTPVNSLRTDVVAACRAAAALPSGRFSLTVPTGGGKTLSAMSFALNHAYPRGGDRRHNRVIVVIPYTSIIEQNAAIYRNALGHDNVVEHHSNLDESRLDEIDPEREARRRLAAENWDAPVVITTSVQFFESLFSNHPSRCRKLHNIARSVIILDEVQTLPPQLLEPILEALRELTEHYGCTVVFSTATPPALVKVHAQPYGLDRVTEIIAKPTDFARRSRRVRVRWEVSEPVSYVSLADRLAEHQQVLAIVHRRRDARELAELLEARVGADGLYHLSALMCPAHRLGVLGRVRAALKEGGPCRLVATQLVEAGVDVDFPVVYRALAGLDSLAQAAGRCDREGRLTLARGGEPGGELIVFRAPTNPPPGVLSKAMESTTHLLVEPLDPHRRGMLDIFDPRESERFFRHLYDKHDLDDRGILADLARLDFATVAAKFRMIDSAARPVVVPHGEATARVDRFRRMPSRRTQRALQPFLVQVSPSHHEALRGAGALETVHERVDVLGRPFWSRYDGRYGLDSDMDGVMDVEVGIV